MHCLYDIRSLPTLLSRRILCPPRGFLWRRRFKHNFSFLWKENGDANVIKAEEAGRNGIGLEGWEKGKGECMGSKGKEGWRVVGCKGAGWRGEMIYLNEKVYIRGKTDVAWNDLQQEKEQN